MTRRRFTEREVVAIVARQLGIRRGPDGIEHAYIICPVCSYPITDEQIACAEKDHDRAVSLFGEDVPSNTRWLHYACHRAKTRQDVARIAKAKRQAGETGQRARHERNGPTMPSRPMQKPADVGRRHNWKTGRMEDA